MLFLMPWLPLVILAAVGWGGSRPKVRRWLLREPLPHRLVSVFGSVLLFLGIFAVIEQIPDGSGDNAWLIAGLPAWGLGLPAIGLLLGAVIPGRERRAKATGGALAVLVVFGSGAGAILALAAVTGDEYDLNGYAWRGPVWRMTAITAATIVAVMGIHLIRLPRLSNAARTPRNSAR